MSVLGKNHESLHGVGWKNLIPLFSCLLCCSLRHDHASSFCLKHGKYLPLSKSSFPLLSSCCEDPKPWARSRSGLKPAESGEISPCLHPGKKIFPNILLLEPKIIRICLENISNKKLCNHISVLVIANDATTAVCSQLIAFNGAQSGVQRQLLQMKMSKLME